MSKALIIVESPTKARCIGRILKQKLGGAYYDVVATCGHVVDLPENSLGIYRDGDKYYLNFTWRSEKQKRFVFKLKKQIEKKKYDYVYLATDPDREGEAISYHLYQEIVRVFPKDRIFRIRLYAITESEILRAISRRERIDLNLVKAQFTRRAIDRIIGYVLSPYYSRLMKQPVSVGRVQTLALYFITDRYRQVKNFVPELYYYFRGNFYPVYVTGSSSVFVAKTNPLPLSEKRTIRKAAEVFQSARGYKIIGRSTRKEVLNPPKPLTTASLQKVAFRKYGFSPEKTMKLAQRLYEKGHCSYVRTDSTDVSPEGYVLAKEFIEKHIGSYYFNEKPVFLNENLEEERKKKHAHECIRPLHFGIPSDLSDDEQRLFYIVKAWFLASHMKPAVVEKISLEILPAHFDALHLSNQEKILRDEKLKRAVTFKAEGSRIAFEGFLKVLKDEFKPENEHLFAFQEGQGLNGLISLKKKKTQPPPLMTPEEVVDALEKSKVGRPSTYATIFQTLKGREYVKGHKKVVPTNLAEELIAQVERKEKRKKKGILIDVDFTARMEKELDDVARGKLVPDAVIGGLEKQIKDVYSVKTVVPPAKSGRALDDKQALSGKSTKKPLAVSLAVH